MYNETMNFLLSPNRIMVFFVSHPRYRFTMYNETMNFLLSPNRIMVFFVSHPELCHWVIKHGGKSSRSTSSACDCPPGIFQPGLTKSVCCPPVSAQQGSENSVPNAVSYPIEGKHSKSVPKYVCMCITLIYITYYIYICINTSFGILQNSNDSGNC